MSGSQFCMDDGAAVFPLILLQAKAVSLYGEGGTPLLHVSINSPSGEGGESSMKTGGTFFS